MEIDITILASGFALGLFFGLLADLINKTILAFACWVMSW